MIYELVFSATGRTENVMNIFSSRWTEEKVRIDLSRVDFDRTEYKFTPDDICILAVPVFEGRMPKPALERVKKLNGNGAKAVLIAVFGNRAVDDCLLEMKDVMKASGFVPVAAIEASVQHSILNRVAASRPDADDRAELKDFAKKIKVLLSEKTAYGELTVPGNYPYVEMGGIKFKPTADEKCIECGLCAQKCPTAAIPKDNPRITDSEKCITCMRCVDICPVKARSLPQPILQQVYAVMKPKFEERKPNALYLAD